MEGQIFKYGYSLPAIMLVIGVCIMVQGNYLYDMRRFSKGLYSAFFAFFIIAFMIAIRISSGVGLNEFEISVLSSSIAMFLFVSISIIYFYVHRILPDFFIRSSLVFSIFCLVTMGINLYEKGSSTEASKADPTRFIESQEYQIQKQKSEATFASQVQPRSLPQ